MILFLFSLTLFGSAFLLFFIQPMFAKMVLPVLGGSPQVWTTCMLFFQFALLGGYAYAHFLAVRLTVRRQILLHLLLMAAAASVLPVALPPGWRPSAAGNPVAELLGILSVTAGLPFFVASTSAPLLQSWFSRLKLPDARDPYFLYASSNGGSLLALLSYPVLVEPGLPLAGQSHAWFCGYGVLILLTALSGWVVFKTSVSRSLQPAAGEETFPADDAGTLSRRRKAGWVFWAFVPSSLMLGLTTFISTDLAPVPLIWVVPFALYLVSFMFAFSRRRRDPRPFLRWLLPFMLVPVAMLIAFGVNQPHSVIILCHLAFFFWAALFCHTELACDRPGPGRLTEFYLWIAVGGLCGGIFNSLLAPVLFNSILEYPLAAALLCFVRPLRPFRFSWKESVPDFLLPLLTGAGMILIFALLPGLPGPLKPAGKILLAAAPPLICFTFRGRSLRFFLGLIVFMLTGMALNVQEHVVKKLYADRSFFGVALVQSWESSSGKYHRLIHGTTIHGMQHQESGREREPAAYYHPNGPVGQFFAASAGTRRSDIAVVGLGSGGLSAYAAAGERWDFYEIDPMVKTIALDPRLFTFLEKCPAAWRIILGDGRLSLQDAADRRYDMIFLDVFSSDAIPVHMMTREAVEIYFRKLKPDGLLIVHISNRYLNLEPVFTRLAEVLRLEGVIQRYRSPHEDFSKSDWIVIGRPGHELLQKLPGDPRWKPLSARGRKVPVWTDQFSDILAAWK